MRASVLFLIVAMVGMCAASYNPCDYVKYCKFCDTECEKCSDEKECLHPHEPARPPNCKYCKWCRACSLCSGARAVCRAGSSIFQYIADKFAHNGDPSLQTPPTHHEIDEALRKAKVEL